MLHPACQVQLDGLAEFVELDPKVSDAYYYLLAGLWAEGVAFVVVEQDIEIFDDTLVGFASCPHLWCLHAYAGPGDVVLDQALGCTRFSSALLAEIPDALSSVHDFSDGLPPRDWRRVDTLLAWKLRMAGHEPHIHTPMVTHHHRY